MIDTTNEVKKGITIRYVTALSLIAILSSIAFYALTSVLKEADSTAYIVNISGKQRMLSQRIALGVHRLHVYRVKEEHESPFAQNQTKQILEQNIKEMRKANTILSTGNLPNGETAMLSPIIYDMYFGDMNLVKRVITYTDLARQTLAQLNHHDLDAIMVQIDAQSAPLLKDLNTVVQQYQKEGEKKLSNIAMMEAGIWALTLLTLLLEVIFIFQPMVHHMVKLASKNEETLKNLENLVEIRTMKLERSNQKLLDLASHDSLTGLRNRLNLEKDIENAIKHYALHHAPYAVLMFDIDWFKKVNDTHGHDIGDLLLIEIAKILQKSVREEDHVYRAGGEEFVILLNRVSYEDTIHIAQKICSHIENYHFECNGIKLRQTISGGVYHSSLTIADNVKNLLKLVDEALYRAKEQGRNQIQEVKKDRNS